MKKYYLLPLLMMTACLFEEDKAKYDETRSSYYLGIQNARSLKNQGHKISLEDYMEGFEKALKDDPDLPTEKEIHGFLLKTKSNLIKEEREKYQGNLLAAKNFLKENKKKEGVKVLNEFVQYEVIEKGNEKGKSPELNQEVAYYSRGKLLDGSTFQDSFKTKKAEKDLVIALLPGLREGVQLMKEGAVYRFYISPQKSYGMKGRNGVPPNSLVIFDLNLAKIY